MAFGNGGAGLTFSALMAYLPFMVMDTETGKIQLDSSRIMEGVLIAAVVGGVSVMGTQRAVEQEIAGVKEDVQQMRKRLNNIEGDIYVPRSKNKAAVPRVEGHEQDANQ